MIGVPNMSLVNQSGFLPVVVEEVVVVKDLCYGLVGYKALLLVLFLFGLNFLLVFFWSFLRGVSFRFWGRRYDLLFVFPLINLVALTFLFVYLYNML